MRSYKPAFLVLIIISVFVAWGVHALKPKRAFRVECPGGADGGSPKEILVPMDGGTAGTPVIADWYIVEALADAGYTGCVKVLLPDTSSAPSGTPNTANASKNFGSSIGPPSSSCPAGNGVFAPFSSGRCLNMGPAKVQINVVAGSN